MSKKIKLTRDEHAELVIAALILDKLLEIGIVSPMTVDFVDQLVQNDIVNSTYH